MHHSIPAARAAAAPSVILAFTFGALGLALPSAAQVVSPVGYATQPGTSNNNYPFYGLLHYQQIHADVRGAPLIIRAQAHRRSSTNANAIARTIELEAWMGEGALATAGGTFLSNYSGPRVNVFTKKNLNTPSWGTPAGSPPYPFDLVIAYDVPFAYSGTQDLIWECDITQNSAANQSYAADAVFAVFACGPTQALGTGCTATGRTVPIYLYGDHCSDPRTMTIDTRWDVYNGPAGASGAFLIGTMDPALPLPGLCVSSLHTNGSIVLPATTDASGYMGLPTQRLPYNAALVGLALYTQAVVHDAGQPSLPLAASHGRRTTVVAMPPLAAFARIFAGTGQNSGSYERGFAIVTQLRP